MICIYIYICIDYALVDCGMNQRAKRYKWNVDGVWLGSSGNDATFMGYRYIWVGCEWDVPVFYQNHCGINCENSLNRQPHSHLFWTSLHFQRTVRISTCTDSILRQIPIWCLIGVFTPSETHEFFSWDILNFRTSSGNIKKTSCSSQKTNQPYL